MELQQKLGSETQFNQELMAKINVRDQEILRLHDMFTPAQNLEKLNLKYQHEQNETAVKKLSNQVDFLNKENNKLERQVEILKGDSNGNLALAQYEGMKKDIDELMFQNSTLQKDYKEATKLLQETQN